MAKTRIREAASSHVVRLLREAREQRAMSMNVLAQRAGLSQSSISLIERGLRLPNLDTLFRIAEVLEVDLGRTIQKAVAAATCDCLRQEK